CDLPRDLVVEVAHPTALFALALAHRADFARSLQPLAARVEAATPHPLSASIAQLACAIALACHVDDRGDLPPQVYAHDPRIGGRLWRGRRVGDLGDPLPPLAFDRQHARRTCLGTWGASPARLSHLTVLIQGQQQRIALATPVLLGPLADGRAQHRVGG